MANRDTIGTGGIAIRSIHLLGLLPGPDTGMEAVFMTFLVLCLLLVDQGSAYHVDQPPPPPILSSDNEISDSRRNEGFDLLLGTLLSRNSDSAFPRFIGPSSNPWLAKDPRSLTEARVLGVFNWVPTEHPWDGGLSQSYLIQLRAALTNRWSIFMDKSGYSFIERNAAGGSVDGWNNLAFGSKFVVVRDVENQFLLTAGFQYELPSGEADVYQRPSDGSLTAFVVAAKEFWCFWHVMGNVGVRAPLSSDGSTLFYSQLHLDRECMGWLHPLVELNYYHISSDGQGNQPAGYGQGDAMIDWSVPGTVGSDLVTLAFGIRAKCNRSAEAGITYEKSLSDTSRVLNHRIVAEFILRY